MSLLIDSTGVPGEKMSKSTELKITKNEAVQAKKSVVRVFFDKCNSAYSYFNDSFDLKVGDFVWVEGKLDGVRGRIIEIDYNFKIKISDYKRVIGVANTDISGKFRSAGRYFITNGKHSYFNTVRTWFMPPENTEEEVVIGHDDSSFDINDLKNVKILDEEVDRGVEYFDEGSVAYIGISEGEGFAIVEGHKPYCVEFRYNDGEISNLICDCYTVGFCRHEFAAMLTLRGIIKHIEEHYPEMNIKDDGFSAFRKAYLFRFVIDSEGGEIFTIEK